MNSLLRVAARTQLSAALRRPLQRRGYADAVSDKIKLTLALPHQVRCINQALLILPFFSQRLQWPLILTNGCSRYTNQPMCASRLRSRASLLLRSRRGQAAYEMDSSVQVNIPAESGEMGVLANHVPSIEQLKPGLVEIIEESGGSKQFFCTCNSLGPFETPGYLPLRSESLTMAVIIGPRYALSRRVS